MPVKPPRKSAAKGKGKAAPRASQAAKEKETPSSSTPAEEATGPSTSSSASSATTAFAATLREAEAATRQEAAKAKPGTMRDQ